MRRRCSRGRDSDSVHGQHVRASRDSSCSAGRAGDAAIVAASWGSPPGCFVPAPSMLPPKGRKEVAKPQDGTGQLQECGASLAPSRFPPGTVRHELEIT